MNEPLQHARIAALAEALLVRIFVAARASAIEAQIGGDAAFVALVVTLGALGPLVCVAQRPAGGSHGVVAEPGAATGSMFAPSAGATTDLKEERRRPRLRGRADYKRRAA